MDLINNIGISYRGDYISQGSQNDKCKKAKQLETNYIEFVINNNGKGIENEDITNIYEGNSILHLPTININQSNLKFIKDIISSSMKNNIKLLTIDASTLLFDTYEFSTTEEQENYLINMARGIASLSNYNIEIAIENTNLEKNNMIFGKSISNISDLLVYVRKILIQEYDFSKEKAQNFIGVSLNVWNLTKTNDIVNLNDWFKVFYNDIKCIKVRNIDRSISLFSQLLDIIIVNNIDVPLLLEITKDIEYVSDEYNKFKYLVNNKLEGKPLNYEGYKSIPISRFNEYNYDFRSSQSGFTNMIIIFIIMFTIICAVLMILVQTRQ